jgi:hypothetical protein
MKELTKCGNCLYYNNVSNEAKSACPRCIGASHYKPKLDAGNKTIIRDCANCFKAYSDTCKICREFSQFTPPGGCTPTSKIADNGTRVAYENGGNRESRVGKGRQDLIEPVLIERLGDWYELGANKYGDRNWELGISVKDCLAAIIRHTFKFSAGYTDEDHLAAIAWNSAAIMRMEEYPKYIKFLDLPHYKKETTDGE